MTGALTGLRVIDSTQHLAGPSCAMFLADMGAEVIKIEPVGRGDTTRMLGKLHNGESPMFTVLNRNKQSLTLNYKDPRGVKIFLELAAQSDIIVENNRPGVMDRLGWATRRYSRSTRRLSTPPSLALATLARIANAVATTPLPRACLAL